MSSETTIECELFRQQCWEHLYRNVEAIFKQQCATQFGRIIRAKELRHLLLRYVFNKIPVRSQRKLQDPVFIEEASPAAWNQLRVDLEHWNVDPTQLPADALIQVIEHRFESSANKLRHTRFRKDALVTVDATTSTLVYHATVPVVVADRRKMGMAHQHDAQRLRALFALNLRYDYLGLGNQGLACLYEDAFGMRPFEFTEGFASLFNQVGGAFFSAFPDLEGPFGSLGSFFDIKADPTLPFDSTSGIRTPWLVVNPPFDETVIVKAARHVQLLLEHAQLQREPASELRVLMIVPDWENFPVLNELTQCRWLVKRNNYAKGTLAFRDWMSSDPACSRIYPCNIVVFTFSSRQDANDRVPDLVRF